MLEDSPGAQLSPGVCVCVCVCVCLLRLSLLQAVWRAERVEDGVCLRHTSPDGDQGYPGEVQVAVTYTLKVQALSPTP